MGWMSRKNRLLLRYINIHITDFTVWDWGAIRIWKDDKGNKFVDIEWADGVSAFYLDKVLKLIEEKGPVTKAEIVDNCL